jgi:hypothetical protein
MAGRPAMQGRIASISIRDPPICRSIDLSINGSRGGWMAGRARWRSRARAFFSSWLAGRPPARAAEARLEHRPSSIDRPRACMCPSSPPRTPRLRACCFAAHGRASGHDLVFWKQTAARYVSSACAMA